MSSPPGSFDSELLTRREALQRAAAVLGVAISPSLLAGALQAQAADTGPRYLDSAQLALVAALAERIIPRTDTPGAIDVGVPAFIDLMSGEYLAPDERVGLLEALAYFESAAARTHRAKFAALTPAQQDSLLAAAAASPSDREHFLVLRELTVVGYFTAEPVGRDVLHYDPIPGPYRGCIPVAEVGNVAWTPPR